MKTVQRDAAQALLDGYDQIVSKFATSFTPPKGLSNSQAELHHKAHVASARRYFSTRLKKAFEAEYESSKKELTEAIEAINPNISPAVGAKLVLMHEDDHFQTYYTVRNGQTKLDDKKLRMHLVAAGVEPDLVEECFAKSKVQGDPQTLIDIIPVGETVDEDQ